jgi:hypothetical protein
MTVVPFAAFSELAAAQADPITAAKVRGKHGTAAKIG